MYKTLHRKMTFFCTLITGLILIIMTFFYIIIAEKNLRQSYSLEFSSRISTFTHTIENENTISFQWLVQLSDNNTYIIRVYDNGHELTYNRLQPDTFKTLIQNSIDTAKTNFNFDILNIKNTYNHTQQLDFNYDNYNVSMIIVPKSSGYVSAVLLQSHEPLIKQISRQRLLFGLIDLVALLLLFAFSWFFTGYLIRPIETARKKQNQFIAAASHELRSPLTVILSGLSAIKDAPQNKQNQFISTMENEGNRMSRLIEDMLAIARTDNRTWTLKKEFCDADTLPIETYEQFSVLAKQQGITLDIQLPNEQLPKLYCDGQRILQILTIFMDNALSYISTNGTIWLSLKVHHSHIHFIVADNGDGISDEDKGKIFDRFYRVDASHQSKEHFGLGLSIAKDIASLHHGNIYVKDSNEMGYAPTGACFILELPITQRAAE